MTEMKIARLIDIVKTFMMHAAYIRFLDQFIAPGIEHGYATKEGCRTEPKSRNLEYAMGCQVDRIYYISIT
jgi:hypothetical protein